MSFCVRLTTSTRGLRSSIAVLMAHKWESNSRSQAIPYESARWVKQGGTRNPLRRAASDTTDVPQETSRMSATPHGRTWTPKPPPGPLRGICWKRQRRATFAEELSERLVYVQHTRTLRAKSHCSRLLQGVAALVELPGGSRGKDSITIDIDLADDILDRNAFMSRLGTIVGSE